MNKSFETLDFWFDLASPYSYLSARRINGLAEAAGVPLRWRPVALGPIFKSQGWNNSPFNLYPVKGRNMWRDLARRAAGYDMAMVRPEVFPQNSITALRIALIGFEEGWGERFVHGAFQAEFVDGADLAERATLAACVSQAGGDAADALQRAGSDPVKAALRAATDEAMTAGVFGAPTFVVGGELFWGDDRLEEALTWAGGQHPLQRAGR